MNPQIPIKAIQEQMQKKYHVFVSKHKAFRAKAKAQVHLRGDVEIQYSLLRDYANELQRCNLDTIVKIDVYGEEDHEKPTRMFRRIYVCLGALKRGFKETGRELLGLDDAFMRGQYSGQMLTAVGLDANNGIYPVAYGIVEYENQYSWTWFLTCLANDFDLYTNSNFTFITDRQKGLVPTIAKLFPAVEHRFCMRHINENMNITWKGGDYKEMLWKCATSTTVVRQLLDARNSSIITLLEYVREYLMKRIVIVQKIIQKSNGPLTPSVTKLFNKIKEVASECTVDWNGSNLFQVKGPYQDQCVVNLNQGHAHAESGKFHASHAKYVLEILKKHGMDKCDSVGTPMATKPKLDADLSGKLVDQTDYRSKIRSLVYLTSSRLDIMQAGTINMGLWYPNDTGFELTTFSDADYVGCLDTCKSTYGEIQFLGDKLVSWMSKEQDCTAMSSTKAEYVALSASCAQVMWMRTQLKDYGFNYNKIPLYCDSQSAIAISCNPVQHSRTKHIHTQYHFIKDQVENGIIELYFVKTEYQLADMFTKALPGYRLQYLVRRIGTKDGVAASLPHAHAPTTRTYYKHQDSRIKKAKDHTTTKTFATLIFKIFLKDIKIIKTNFQEDAKYEHVSQDTRSQDGKDDKDKQRKDLKISESKTKSKDNDKG
ncbi:retrovirus-related pol polyprotein from transposon TNT 1-94 [Tanacetum coccineum]